MEINIQRQHTAQMAWIKTRPYLRKVVRGCGEGMLHLLYGKNRAMGFKNDILNIGAKNQLSHP